MFYIYAANTLDYSFNIADNLYSMESNQRLYTIYLLFISCIVSYIFVGCSESQGYKGIKDRKMAYFKNSNSLAIVRENLLMIYDLPKDLNFHNEKEGLIQIDKLEYDTKITEILPSTANGDKLLVVNSKNSYGKGNKKNFNILIYNTRTRKFEKDNSFVSSIYYANNCIKPENQSHLSFEEEVREAYWLNNSRIILERIQNEKNVLSILDLNEKIIRDFDQEIPQIPKYKNLDRIWGYPRSYLREKYNLILVIENWFRSSIMRTSPQTILPEDIEKLICEFKQMNDIFLVLPSNNDSSQKKVIMIEPKHNLKEKIYINEEKLPNTLENDTNSMNSREIIHDIIDYEVSSKSTYTSIEKIKDNRTMKTVKVCVLSKSIGSDTPPSEMNIDGIEPRYLNYSLSSKWMLIVYNDKVYLYDSVNQNDLVAKYCLIFMNSQEVSEEDSDDEDDDSDDEDTEDPYDGRFEEESGTEEKFNTPKVEETKTVVTGGDYYIDSTLFINDKALLIDLSEKSYPNSTLTYALNLTNKNLTSITLK